MFIRLNLKSSFFNGLIMLFIPLCKASTDDIGIIVTVNDCREIYLARAI
jgi:hypothetical protein